MYKTFLMIFIFITILSFSQDIKIKVYDNTADYWKDFYENQNRQIEEMTVKNFTNYRKIKLYYKGDWRRRVCRDCKYPYKYMELKKYILYSCYEINNYSFSYGKFRGICRFGNWYFFKLVDWYELKYEDIERTYYNIYVYNYNDKKEIKYTGTGNIIAKTSFIEFKDERRKAIEFYYIYNDIEKYSFTIIFQSECFND